MGGDPSVALAEGAGGDLLGLGVREALPYFVAGQEFDIGQAQGVLSSDPLAELLRPIGFGGQEEVALLVQANRIARQAGVFGKVLVEGDALAHHRHVFRLDELGSHSLHRTGGGQAGQGRQPFDDDGLQPGAGKKEG